MKRHRLLFVACSALIVLALASPVLAAPQGPPAAGRAGPGQAPFPGRGGESFVTERSSRTTIRARRASKG